MSAEDRVRLTRLGMPVPPAEATKFSLLRTPANQREGTTDARELKKPTHRSFPKKAFKRRPIPASKVKALQKQLSARRLKPEDVRAFYTTEWRRAQKKTAFYRNGGDPTKVKKNATK